MKFRNVAATATIAVAALSITAVTANSAYADPASPSVATDIAPGIQYQASVVDHAVVLTTAAGSMSVKDNLFQILDSKGAAVATLPMSYQNNGKTYPIAAKIDGNTATLTPNVDPLSGQPLAADTPTIKDIAAAKDIAADKSVDATAKDVDATANPNFNQALTNLSGAVTVGVAVGTLIGTAIGATIGCIAGGAILGAGATVATIGTLTVPGAIGGCLVTGAAAGAIGAVAGTILIGGPVAAAALFQFASDLLSPPAPAPAS
ncbi:hypothetical protein [Nocardia sp. NBC_00511]|uniref:hypothetical protein n=1 Tax=Nocardia sp. NBC_00511 TaxID=2903591 RepID=UPI0030E46026